MYVYVLASPTFWKLHMIYAMVFDFQVDAVTAHINYNEQKNPYCVENVMGLILLHLRTQFLAHVCNVW